jgi:hypothetical protein
MDWYSSILVILVVMVWMQRHAIYRFRLDGENGYQMFEEILQANTFVFRPFTGEIGVAQESGPHSQITTQ